jgi:nicotinamide-nucleotide amidase
MEYPKLFYRKDIISNIIGYSIMPTAEIIAIGTELLLGVTQDTNTRFIVQELNRIGVDIFRSTTIGDNVNRISQVIQEALNRSDIVVTSGGLGPTIDDPTRQAAADAFRVKLVFHPDLWDAIKRRFERAGRILSENNRRQAYIPQNAVVINNSVGTAPAFSIEKDHKLLICLPGVPAELKYLLQTAVIPLINQKYPLKQIIFSRIVHTCGLGESKVDEMIGDFEKMSNPTVGLTAYPGMVDIRITVKAADENTANQIIQPILDALYQRLGDYIYGLDEEKLVDKVREKKVKANEQLSLILTSNSSHFQDELKPMKIFDQILIEALEGEQLEDELRRKYNTFKSPIIGVDQIVHPDGMVLQIFWAGKNGFIKENKHFSSHSSLFIQWSINSILDYLRRNIN